ncbi:hypothetical protein COT72_02655 [archaeon CG10_big_fil_rev_8_21_14_0_10_43_11]|nr:MAG: hypothetical protein COT72_02655 [archaeon CG10_big_fil_rev_8_21_14_0_10_43_11]
MMPLVVSNNVAPDVQNTYVSAILWGEVLDMIDFLCYDVQNMRNHKKVRARSMGDLLYWRFEDVPFFVAGSLDAYEQCSVDTLLADHTKKLETKERVSFKKLKEWNQPITEFARGYELQGILEKNEWDPLDCALLGVYRARESALPAILGVAYEKKEPVSTLVSVNVNGSWCFFQAGKGFSKEAIFDYKSGKKSVLFAFYPRDSQWF